MNVQDKIGDARASGYSWGEINDHLEGKTQEALDAGYSQRQIDDHLGYQDPLHMRNQLSIQAAGKAPDAPPGLDPVARQTYVDGLLTGTTKGPQDFAAAYHAAGHEPIPDLDTMLPDHGDATDHAIALTHDADLPLTTKLIQQTKANMLDRWATTGQGLSDIYEQASRDPRLRDQLTSLPASNLHMPALAAIVHIESGGNPGAVSRTGAVGLGQIEPYTARGLGFDPGQLKDPAYNIMVTKAVLTHNAQMFPGDLEAQLIAYNAGPGRAEKWLAAGRDDAVLPEETQGYIAKYAKIAGTKFATALDVLKEPARAAWQMVETGAGTLWGHLQSGEQKAEQMTLVPDPLTVATKDIEDIKGGQLPGGVTPEQIAMSIGEGGAGEGAEAAGRGLPDVGNWLRQAFKVPLREETEEPKSVMRMATGVSRQASAQAAVQLEQYKKAVNAHLPEYVSYLKLDPTVRAANEPYLGKPLLMNLIEYIEGRSKGVTLDQNSPFTDVADALRDIYASTAKNIQTGVPNFESFLDDYYRHMWTDPNRVGQVTGAGRMGDSSSLKLRKIPTIADGLNLGLTPRFLNPIDNTLDYVTGMQNYLAQQQVFNWGRDQELIKYSGPGEQPEGWEPLKGRGALKSIAFNDEEGNAQARTMIAHAPPGFARPYNNWAGKGFYENGGATANVFDKLQRASNFMTMWKLGLSAYHAATMTKELINAGYSQGFGDLAYGIGRADLGQVANGLWNVFGTTFAPIKITQQLVRGGRLARAYLKQADYGKFMSGLDDLTHMGDGSLQLLAQRYAEAGGRVLSRGAEYQVGGDTKNLWKAWRQGADLFADRFRENGPLTAFVKSVGDVLTTTTAPLFDYAIPRIKFAAWADEMQSWLRRNPTAGPEAQRAMARRLSDSIDDRFGEMVLDNLFWPRAVKQMANAATISVGWNYGTARMVGKGTREIAKGIGNLGALKLGGAAEHLLSPEARALYTYPAAMALTAAAYQYLKTGTAPGQDQNSNQFGYEPGTFLQDIAAPRTGGAVQIGGAKGPTVPERAQLPGYDKDFDNWYFDIANSPTLLGGAANFAENLPNKLNPMLTLGKQLLTQKNYFDEPIIQHEGIPGLADFGKYVVQQMLPIWAEQAQRRQAGSNIGTLENVLGPRTAPTNLLDPAYARGAAYAHWHNAVKQEQRWQAIQEQRAKSSAAPAGEPNAAPTPNPTPEASPQPALPPVAPTTFKRSHHAIKPLP